MMHHHPRGSQDCTDVVIVCILSTYLLKSHNADRPDQADQSEFVSNVCTGGMW